MADGTIKILTELVTDGLKTGLKTATALIASAAAGLAALGTAAIKVGIDWESAFAGVKKTVEATDEELQALSSGLRDLSHSIPTSAGSLAEIAEAAGQLGIETDSILGFTETMANLGVATNMSATDAASSLAKLANITGLSQKDFDRLGSTVVALGNNLATTEADIVAMTMRIAGAGSQVGMTEAEMLSFAGALSSVGIEAEAGGTAFSTLISKMSLASAKGGKELQQFAEVAGMSADEFKTAFEEDAAGAISAFVTGLGKINEEGGSAIGTLDQMGLSDIRMRDALLRAAGASDVFTEALSLGTKAWDENTALANEAAQRYETVESKIQLLKNSAADLGISVYESVQPALKDLVDEATGLLDQLHTAFQERGFAGLAEEIGNVLATVVTKITDAAPTIINAAVGMIEGLISGIEQNLPEIVRSALETVSSFIKGLASALPKLVKAGISLANELISGIGKQLPDLIPVVVEALLEVVETIAKNVPGMVKAGIELIRGLLKGILKAIPQIIKALPQLIDAILNGILEAIPLIIEAAIEFFMAIVEAIPVIIQALVAALPDIITTIINFLIQAVPMLIEGAIQLFMALIEAIPVIIVELVKAIPQIIAAIVEGLLNGVAQIFGAAIELFSPLSAGLEETNKKFDETIERAGAFGQALQDASPSLLEYNNLLSNTGKSIRDIDTAVDETETAITEILKTALAEQQGLRDEDLENIRKYMDDLNALQMEKLEIYRSQQIGILERLKADKETLTVEEMAQHNANVQAALEEANRIVDEACTNELAILYNKHQAAGTLNSEAYAAERQAIVDKWNAEKEINQQNANEALGIIVESAGAQVNVEKDKWQQMSAFTETLSKKNLSDFEWWCMKMSGTSATLEKVYKEHLNGMDVETAGAFLSMAASAAKGGKELDAETKETARLILQNFDDLPDELDAAGKDTLLGMISGIEGQIPGLSNTAEMSADEIVDAIRTALDCHSPSKVTEEIGKNTVQGLEKGIKGSVSSAIAVMRKAGQDLSLGMRDGMRSQESALVSEAKRLANKVTKSFKTTLDIHSPSRRMAREVGKPTAQGIGVGFRQSLSGVIRSMQQSIDAEFSRIPSGVQQNYAWAGGRAGAISGGATYNITNNVESPVPITVAESAREANRQTELTLFELGVYGI